MLPENRKDTKGLQDTGDNQISGKFTNEKEIIDTACSKSIWTKEFLFICLITFLAYANNSVFFTFYEYLRSLPINPESLGLLIAVFSAVSLIVRPLISPFIHPGNARSYLFIGTIMVILTLASYTIALNFWSMLIVRVLHGLAFVIMGTALMALTIEFIPKDRSAQVFGLLAIVILIPNTIIPPILPLLSRTMGGFTGMLTFFAIVTILVFPLVKALKKPHDKDGFFEAENKSCPNGENNAGMKKLQTKPLKRQGMLSRHEIFQDIMDPRVAALLIAMLLFFSTYALIFFFLDGYGRSIGISSTGFFMTLATASEIGVRLIAGSLFDRMNKSLLISFTMLGLAAAYSLLGYVHNTTEFFMLGGLLGIGWGIAMPVFNGLMFDISSSRFQAFNLNLGLQMFQGGFFLGPFIGGPIVDKWGFSALFNVCAVMNLSALIFSFYLWKKIKKNEDAI